MSKLSEKDEALKEFLEEKYYLYHNEKFIESDPIQIPHQFAEREDIEISAFLAAAIAWGKRPMIIRNAQRLLSLMENSPYEFIMNAKESDFERFENFKHRTFNGEDAVFFLKSLSNIYKNHGGLKQVFEKNYQKTESIFQTLIEFRKIFFEIEFPQRTSKHIANVEKKSAAKRLNMFLRWMVRSNSSGVDFGLWEKIPTSALYIPLDVHSGNVSRELKLLTRNQNDWKSVEELTSKLRIFDKNDPVKYDYALFGLGVFEGGLRSI